MSNLPQTAASVRFHMFARNACLAAELTVNYRPPGMDNRTSRILAVISFLFCIGMTPAYAGEIRVAVAANFAPTLTEIAGAFEAKTGHQVIVASGSTGKQYAQIINGAPFDAFFAADVERPRLLDEAGIGIPGSRYTYAVGRLTLWSPQPDFIDDEGAVLFSDAYARLAIANPRLAPYGLAAQEVLEELGLWEKLQDRLVRGENINQAFQFVHSGNAQLGFIAASQLTGEVFAASGSRWQVPATLHAPIRQQAILLTNSDVARQFMEFSLSSEADHIITDNGYDLPHREPEQN